MPDVQDMHLAHVGSLPLDAEALANVGKDLLGGDAGFATAKRAHSSSNSEPQNPGL